MFESKRNDGKAGAIVLIVFSLVALAVLGTRQVQLQDELRDENATLVQSRNRAAAAAFDRLALPPNRKLTVCNQSGKDLTISALTAVYIDKEGRPSTFNSAINQWHAWRIQAGSTEMLGLDDEPGAGWDGSALFYAIEVSGEHGTELLSGTSDDLKGGCIRLTPHKS
jgi:hypothetical protein